MNLQEELKALKERIAELEERAKEEDGFPQKDDTYWYINSYGVVSDETWENHLTDTDMLEIGNVYKTKEQAEFAVEKLKVEAELRKFSRPFKRGRFNHYIFIDTDGNHLEVNSLIYGQPQGTFYFDSKEVALEAIDAAGDWHIKKYIFGMEV